MDNKTTFRAKSLIGIVAFMFACMPAMLVSCDDMAAEEEYHRLDAIVIPAKNNQFLRNFVGILDGKLVQTISYDEAVRAGATANGYYNFVEQIATLNRSLKPEDLPSWIKNIRWQTESTILKSSNIGSYDRYHVWDSDMFLEYFVMYRGDSAYLTISKERALLLGATEGGYTSIVETLAKDLPTIIRDGISFDFFVQSHYDKLNKLYTLAADMPNKSAIDYYRIPTRDMPFKFCTGGIFGTIHSMLTERY